MTTTASAAERHFRAVAPKYMRMFMEDFDASELDAAAVFGNFGYESAGFTAMQEIKPVVKGSRGGYGWPMFTGDRRVAYEAYCRRHGYDPASPDANYKGVFVELIGPEKGAITKLKAAKTLDDKVVAFENAYERAGVKAYAKRKQWARIALDALRTTEAPDTDHVGPDVREPMPVPVDTFPAPKSPTTRPSFLALAVIVGLAVLAALGFWLFHQQAAEPAAALGSFPAGAPVPMDRPVTLFGGPGGGGSNLFAEIGFQILLAFVGPLISAAATAAVGWVVYWWGKVLKTDFDQKSADTLHAALERGILAAIEHFGARAAPAKLTAHAAEYANKWSGGTVKRFGLSHDDLQQLAEPHLAAVKLGGGK